jgi:hypothetical protein
MNLSLYDPELTAQFLGGGHSGVRTFRRYAPGHRNAVVSEQSFRLVFVQIHGKFSQWRAASRTKSDVFCRKARVDAKQIRASFTAMIPAFVYNRRNSHSRWEILGGKQR